MEVKQIIFDQGVNITGKLCAFRIETYMTRHKLDGVYGVSGAERSKDDEETGIIKTIDVYRSEYNIKNQDRLKVLNVKIIDQGKLLQEVVF